MKWAVIGGTFSRERYQTLEKELTKVGIANQLEMFEVTANEFLTKLIDVTNRFEQVRIEMPFGVPLVEMGRGKTMMVEALQAADTLLKKDGQWWLNASLFYGFNAVFSRQGQDLDLNSEVLVVGAGAAARLAIAAAVRSGFSAIAVTARSEEKGQRLVKQLARKFFGIKFRFIPQDQLVLLPGTCGLVINTTPLSNDNDLLVELDYLNFLRPDGMIWDLVLRPATTPLIREGEQIGVRCVRGYEIAALSDLEWLKWACPSGFPELNLIEAYRTVFSEDPLVPPMVSPTKSRTLD